MSDYKILLVDDDVRYAESFIDKAKLRDLDIIHISDWESAFSEIKQNFSTYGAIIIDGRGKLNQDKKGDDPKHLNQALNDIKELHGSGLYIPYFINTAYYTELSEYFGDQPIYDKKKNEEDKLLDAIIKAVSEIEIRRIKTTYSDVFEIFSKGYLDKKDENLFIKLIMNIDKKELSDIKGNLTSIRALQESIHNALKSDRIKIVPKTLNKFNDINKHLDGNLDSSYKPTTEVYQNSTISSLSKTLYWVCGEYIHKIDNQSYQISHYTIKSLLFNLMELLIWYKNICSKHIK